MLQRGRVVSQAQPFCRHARRTALFGASGSPSSASFRRTVMSPRTQHAGVRHNHTSAATTDASAVRVRRRRDCLFWRPHHARVSITVTCWVVAGEPVDSELCRRLRARGSTSSSFPRPTRCRYRAGRGGRQEIILLRQSGISRGAALRNARAAGVRHPAFSFARGYFMRRTRRPAPMPLSSPPYRYVAVPALSLTSSPVLTRVLHEGRAVSDASRRSPTPLSWAHALPSQWVQWLLSKLLLGAAHCSTLQSCTPSHTMLPTD